MQESIPLPYSVGVSSAAYEPLNANRHSAPALSLSALFPFVGTVIASAGLLLILSGFAILKETPLFWLNAGGWPIWLRDMVKFTFYPLFGLEGCAMLVLSMLLLFSKGLGPMRMPAWLVGAILWAWNLAVVVVVVANNISNLLGNRPLHWHPF